MVFIMMRSTRAVHYLSEDARLLPGSILWILQGTPWIHSTTTPT